MKIFTIALACLFLIGGWANAQSSVDFNCDAEPSPEALEYLRRTHAQRLTHLENQTSRSIEVVKITIHIIRTDAGALGISEANVQARIDNANLRYKDANIVLETCGPFRYIDDTGYSTFNKGADETIRAANDVPGTINIYFANSVLSGATSICGYAKFPTAATAASGTNFTVVQNGCHESSFAHELGHCFGLLHTHSTSGGAELVDRSSAGNCATASDGFCDTPADPQLGTGTVDGSCNYTGVAVDADGDTYVPDPNNIMSYSRKLCRTQFSPSQLSSANYSADTDYVLSNCEPGPVTCSVYRVAFPYLESFESGLPAGWAQGADDDGNWTNQSGGTPSLNTGPASAQSGSYYYYTESSISGTGYPSKTFSLMSPCFSTVNCSQSYISFYNHMYGATMGELKLQLSYDEGNTWTTLWSQSGDQGNVWDYVFVSLTDYLEQPSLRLRFFATTGTSYTSDIAIDRIYMVKNTLSGYAELPYVDGFESGSFNGFWTTGSSNGFGRVQVTSNNQPGGEYHATMDVNTNNNYATNTMDLGVQLAYYPDVEMSFDWKEFSDESHAADGVYLSVNGGGAWTKIYDLTGGTSIYQRVTLDIKALATTAGLTLTDNSKIRFQQYDNYGITTDGIAIDNILIKDPGADIDESALASAFGAPAKEGTPLAPSRIEGFEFYPNPFTNQLNISIPDGYGSISNITVYDLTGKTVFQASNLAEGQRIAVGSDFAAGVYMVRVQAQDAVEAFKVIKTE